MQIIQDAEAAAQDVLSQRDQAVQSATDRVSRLKDSMLMTNSQASPVNQIGGTAPSSPAAAATLGSPSGQSQASGGPFMWGDQTPAMKYLISHESGGRTTAKNPKSTAFGVGQLLDYNRKSYSKQLGIQDPNTTDYNDQLRMMELYIKQRYGTPENAQKFWQSHGWY